MRILGIDPGSRATGFGLVDGAAGRLRLVDAGTVRPGRDLSLPDRLRVIHEALLELVDRHGPAVMAVESVFSARNPRSSLVLGQARGAILLAAALRDVPVAEYAPREVKMAVTGNGAAVKEQVRFMVVRLLGLARPPASLDASDALAVALCHLLREKGRRTLAGKGAGG